MASSIKGRKLCFSVVMLSVAITDVNQLWHFSLDTKHSSTMKIKHIQHILIRSRLILIQIYLYLYSEIKKIKSKLKVKASASISNFVYVVFCKAKSSFCLKIPQKVSSTPCIQIQLNWFPCQVSNVPVSLGRHQNSLTWANLCLTHNQVCLLLEKLTGQISVHWEAESWSTVPISS